MQRLEAYFPQNVAEIVLDSLTQWDKDVLLHVSGDDIPETFEIHIGYEGIYEAFRFPVQKVDGIATIKIPNILLQQTRKIKAWIYVSDAEGCRTTKTITIPLAFREKPADYSASIEPTQKDIVEEILENSRKALETVDDLEERANSGEFKGDKGEKGDAGVCENGVYELIEEITIGAGEFDILRETEPNGTPYKFKKIMAVIESNGMIGTGGDIWFRAYGSPKNKNLAIILQEDSTTTNKTARVEHILDSGILTCRLVDWSNSNWIPKVVKENPFIVPLGENTWLRAWRIKKNTGLLPEGLKVKIYGVRA